VEQAAAGSGELVGLAVGARVVVVPSSPSAPGAVVVGVSARPVIRQAQRGDHQQDRALPPVPSQSWPAPGAGKRAARRSVADAAGHATGAR
jgi:hypothetical protein